MTKAKISTHKGIAESAFGPFHVAIFASDQADVSEKAITEKVKTSVVYNLSLMKWFWWFFLHKKTQDIEQIDFVQRYYYILYISCYSDMN